MCQDEVSSRARVHSLLHQTAVFIHFGIRLRDDVLVFFPRSEIKDVRFPVHESFAVTLQRFVCFANINQLNHFAGAVIGIARMNDFAVIDNATIFDFAIRTFNEAEIIDAGITRKR